MASIMRICSTMPLALRGRSRSSAVARAAQPSGVERTAAPANEPSAAAARLRSTDEAADPFAWESPMQLGSSDHSDADDGGSSGRRGASKRTAAIMLPLDHYTILGLPLRAGNHAIKRAAEQMISTPPPHAGYSQVCDHIKASKPCAARLCVLSANPNRQHPKGLQPLQKRTNLPYTFRHAGT